MHIPILLTTSCWGIQQDNQIRTSFEVSLAVEAEIMLTKEGTSAELSNTFILPLVITNLPTDNIIPYLQSLISQMLLTSSPLSYLKASLPKDKPKNKPRFPLQWDAPVRADRVCTKNSHCSTETDRNDEVVALFMKSAEEELVKVGDKVWMHGPESNPTLSPLDINPWVSL